MDIIRNIYSSTGRLYGTYKLRRATKGPTLGVHDNLNEGKLYWFFLGYQVDESVDNIYVSEENSFIFNFEPEHLNGN